MISQVSQTPNIGRWYTRTDGVTVQMPATATLDIEVTADGTTIRSRPRPGMELEWIAEFRTFAKELQAQVEVEATATTGRQG